MAAKMKKAINRAVSPMKLVEETYGQKPKIVEMRKQLLVEGQKKRSPFLIGSIEEVNQRISELDSALQGYTELVIESRASDNDSQQESARLSDKGRELSQKRDKEAKELNMFAGIYAIKSAFTPGMSEGIRQISALNINQNKAAAKVDTRKPMLVEVHTYPGYDPHALTDLPYDVTPVEVFRKVADAYVHLEKKATYKPEFERLFYSQMSQAILQDVFWWFWLENYMKNSKHYQVKLFNRVAYNYVKLLTYANQSNYKETFFREYPELLTLAVYAAFCNCFPHSLHQFNIEFRENLVNLVFDWVTGVRPAPRTWKKWNLEKLEPKGIKLDDSVSHSKASDKDSGLHFDFVESQASRQGINGGVSTMSMSSLTSYPISRTSLSLGHPHTSALQDVSQAQTAGPLANRKMPKAARRNSRQGRLSEVEQLEALTPVIESTDDVAGADQLSNIAAPVMTLRPRKNLGESHPMGKGPEFVKKVFNVYGQSPLVAHFMRMNNLQKEAGTSMRVQRTEMNNLPPLDSLTYRDFIGTSFKSIRQFDVAYQGLLERSKKHHSEFLRKLQKDKQEFRKREAAIMSQPRDLKCLSDILMMELKRDEDSIGSSASKAVIEGALMGD